MKVSVASFAALTLLTPHSFGQCEIERLTTATNLAPTGFGLDVELSGDYAVASSMFQGELSMQVFHRFGMEWLPLEILTPGVGTDFNGVTAIDEDVFIVGKGSDGTYGAGDPNGPSPSGEIDIFDLTAPGGFVEQTVIPSDATSGQGFGASVDVDDGVIVVGAPGDAITGFGDGSVYVLEKQNGVWVETAKLIADDPTQFAGFGSNVAIEGDTIVVGTSTFGIIFDIALMPLFLPQGPGTVYVFEKIDGNWRQVQKLESQSDRITAFGRSFDLSNDTLMIGALEGDGLNPPIFSPALGVAHFADGDGIVLAYEKQNGQYVETQTLSANGVPSFGETIDLDGDVALITAPNNVTPNGEIIGSAYTFTLGSDGWREDMHFEGASNDGLGLDASLHGGIAMLGAGLAHVNGVAAGEAVLYGVGADCSGNGLSDACDIMNGTLADVNGNLLADACEDGGAKRFCKGTVNSAGATAELDAFGSMSVATNDLMLQLVGATPDSHGLVMIGDRQDETAFGSGLRCVGGSVQAQFFVPTTSTGGALVPFDAVSTRLPISAFTTWNFQVAYRDSAAELQLSNAVSVDFIP